MLHGWMMIMWQSRRTWIQVTSRAVGALVVEEEARLDILRLLDLLSDKPLEPPSSTEISCHDVKSVSGHLASARAEPVDWSFKFP